MKYKGFLLATTGGLAAMSGAQAADLPMKAARVMPAPMPVASWDGFYVGLNGGFALQTAQSGYGNPADGDGQGGGKVGFIGGGQIGYNWQVSPMWVLGVEADISGLTGKVTQGPEFNNTKGNGLEASINWLSTFRGRVGWLMHPDTMLYATGGLAVGGIKNSWNPNGLNAGCCGPTKSVSKTKTGWVAGGGIEHMFMRNWTIGVEALYVDLGNTSANSATPGKSSTFKNSAVIGRLKLNYKF
jgi:outer membrane immunogenic protein